MALELRKAKPEDFPALQQLLELYQYELSDVWPQKADGEAKYGYNLERHLQDERFHAHIAKEGSQYVGFALVAPAIVTRTDGKWMEQFFILKRHRRNGAGQALALHTLQCYPGPWEVGQMPANTAAQAFWRQVIGAHTGGDYVEVQVTEGWWQGVVQQLYVPAAANKSFERTRTMSLSRGVGVIKHWPAIPRVVEHAPRPGDIHPLTRKLLLRLLPRLHPQALKGISRIELRARVSPEVGDPFGAYSPRDALIRLYSVPFPNWPWGDLAVLRPQSRLALCGATLVRIDGRDIIHWERLRDVRRYYSQVLAHELGHHRMYRLRRTRSLPETMRGHEQVANRRMWWLGMRRAFELASEAE